MTYYSKKLKRAKSIEWIFLKLKNNICKLFLYIQMVSVNSPFQSSGLENAK